MPTSTSSVWKDDTRSLYAQGTKVVHDEILNLFVARHETTALSLAWALYLLVRHPEIYKKAQAEADELPGEPGVAELPRLDLILRVFKETLRIYAPLPLYTREPTRDLAVPSAPRTAFPCGSIAESVVTRPGPSFALRVCFQVHSIGRQKALSRLRSWRF
jgi:cytochrome P450